MILACKKLTWHQFYLALFLGWLFDNSLILLEPFFCKKATISLYMQLVYKQPVIDI